MRTFKTSAYALLAACFAAAGFSQSAEAAGTAYNVDTSEVGDTCRVESWTSFAANRDLLSAISGSCAFQFAMPTEISTQFARSRSVDEWASAFTPKIKLKLKDSDIGVFGLAITSFGSFDTATGENTSFTFMVPSTVRITNQTRVNLNLGYTRDNVFGRDFLAYGAGFDIRTPANNWIATFEFYGLAGDSSGMDPNTVRPRGQVGLRWRPVEAWSADILYGRNLNGENSHWITFATAYRFSLGK